MNATQRKLAADKRLIAKLRKENKALKAKNRRLTKKDKKLVKQNRQLSKSSKQHQVPKKIPRDQIGITPPTSVSGVSYYRYSVSYFNAHSPPGGMTIRAEVYTNYPLDKYAITSQLQQFIRMRISHSNKGLQKIFAGAMYVGTEARQIGSNDVGRSQLNRMHFSVD